MGKLSDINPNDILQIDRAKAPKISEPTASSEFEEGELPSSLGEDIEALAMGLGQGATFGFGDEALAALEAVKETGFGDKKLENILSTYREAQKRNEAAYEEMAKKHPGLTLAGELAGGFLLPVPGGAARAVSKGIGLEKALATALSSAKGPATKLAEHMGTGAVLGALGGLGSSKGTIEGTLPSAITGLPKEKEGVLGDIGIGAGFGAGVGALSRGLEKVLGGAEQAVERDISAKRAKAAYELQKGTRKGYEGPVDYTEARVITGDVDPLSQSGGEKIINRVSDVAKNLREEGFGIRDEQKKILASEFDRVKDTDVYDNPKLQEYLYEYINDPFFGIDITGIEPKARAKFSSYIQDRNFQGLLEDQKTFRQVYDYLKSESLFNPFVKNRDGTISYSNENRLQTFLNKYPWLIKPAQADPEITKFLKAVDRKTYDKIRGQEVTVSELQNFRKALLTRGSKIAADMNLSDESRNFIFGLDEYKRLDPEDIRSGGLADYLEDVIGEFIPTIKENRKLIKAASTPMEMLLSGSDDPALTKVRLYDYNDPDIQNKVQKELEKIIKKLGGSNQQAHDFEKLFNQFRAQIRERNKALYGDKPVEFKKAMDRIKQIEEDVDLASMDFSALVAEKGIDSVIDDSISSVKNAYTNIGEMPVSKGAKILGKTAAKIKETGKEIPSIISTPIGGAIKAPFNLAKANLNDLKEAALLLSSNKNPSVANFGKSMSEGLQTGHTGKAVFLNSAYQSPKLRQILGLTPGKQPEDEEEEEESGRSDGTTY